MVEKPTPQFGVMRVGDVEVAMLPNAMPVIYFDSAPSLSHLNGIIGVTLVVTGNVPTADGNIAMCASVAAHLKCNVQAALALRSALDAALLLAQPVEKPEGRAN